MGYLVPTEAEVDCWFREGISNALLGAEPLIQEEYDSIFREVIDPSWQNLNAQIQWLDVSPCVSLFRVHIIVSIEDFGNGQDSRIRDDISNTTEALRSQIKPGDRRAVFYLPLQSESGHHVTQVRCAAKGVITK